MAGDCIVAGVDMQPRKRELPTPARHDTVSLKDVQLHPALLESHSGKPERVGAPAQSNPYLAHRSNKGQARSSKVVKPSIKLHEPGKFIRHQEKAKQQDELLSLMREVDQDVELDSAAMFPTDTQFWWDLPFLCNGSLSYAPINEFIHDPQPVPLPLAMAEALCTPAQPLFLTPRERKKVRRERRLAEQKDRQEQQRLGLALPDKPKRKLASLIAMASSGPVGDAVAGPTAREAEIRAEADQRRAAHDAANAARAQDAAGKRERLLKKYREDLTEGDVYCTLIRLPPTIADKDAFKLGANARQNHLLGCMGTCSQFSFVYLEGGAAATRRYKHLVSSRMPSLQPVSFVYEGPVRRPSFQTFQSVSGDFDARLMLEERGLGDVWRMLVSYMSPK